jgi:predicted DNA-binding protein
MTEQAITKLKPPPMRPRSVRLARSTESYLAQHVLAGEQAYFIRTAVEEKIQRIEDERFQAMSLRKKRSRK